jgi:hypothetical protein
MLITLPQAAVICGVDYEQKCREMDLHSHRVCVEHNLPPNTYSLANKYENKIDSDDLVIGKIHDGIYQTGLNFHLHLTELLGRNNVIEYQFRTAWTERFVEYGVCDDVVNFLEHYAWIESDPRYFIVSFAPMLKSEQPPDGGWRWHKWGEYIGHYNPTHEYLYDEPDIERVECYHIFEIKPQEN